MANGFEWRYNLHGGDKPLIKTFVMQDTETFTRGDVMNVESGKVDLAVTSDAGLAGVFVGPEDPADAKEGSPGVVAGTTAVTVVKVIINDDAVYAVSDSNARNAGATLDIAGTTGAQGVAASANTEFVVVERKRATSDDTLVMLTPAAHYLAKT